MRPDTELSFYYLHFSYAARVFFLTQSVILCFAKLVFVTLHDNQCCIDDMLDGIRTVKIEQDEYPTQRNHNETIMAMGYERKNVCAQYNVTFKLQWTKEKDWANKLYLERARKKRQDEERRRKMERVGLNWCCHLDANRLNISFHRWATGYIVFAFAVFIPHMTLTIYANER